ncbi:MAG: tripartite tricarboxylate transporter substrate binding protein [Firmicutes bacterium]|nr:tripartite tricarboxylate transporter substrate binding protein [Bacillota bacterium]
MKKRSWLIVSLTLLMVFACVNVYAAKYPSKPVEVIIPYNPGGGSDITSRIIAKYIPEYLGETMVVVNIAGAQGKIGEMEVLNARPDGHKLLWQHHVMHCLHITGVTNYTWKDFTPIAVGAKSDNVVVVKSDSPWQTINDFVKDAKANPGKYIFEFAPGTTNQFGVLQMISDTGIEVNFVPKSGDNPRMVSLLGGHCDITVVALNSALSFYESGDVRILGTMGTSRSKYVPDIPTLIEQGIQAELYNEYVLYAPKGISKEVETKIRDAFRKVMTRPEVIKEFDNVATEINFMEKEETIQRLESIFNTYMKLGQDFGIAK